MTEKTKCQSTLVNLDYLSLIKSTLSHSGNFAVCICIQRSEADSSRNELFRRVKTEEFVEEGEKQHTNLWQLKDDVTVEATCREPTALLCRHKEREKETERLDSTDPVATGPHVTWPFWDCSAVTRCDCYVGTVNIITSH